mmetsp:Transcript_35648/g.75919  ORF Transcript_35648/g.75919 Transcript_35648/m.75919 type:complete len:293 (-) Transcript_35648:922-1800(-)
MRRRRSLDFVDGRPSELSAPAKGRTAIVCVSIFNWNKSDDVFRKIMRSTAPGTVFFITGETQAVQSSCLQRSLGKGSVTILLCNASWRACRAFAAASSACLALFFSCFRLKLALLPKRFLFLLVGDAGSISSIVSGAKATGRDLSLASSLENPSPLPLPLLGVIISSTSGFDRGDQLSFNPCGRPTRAESVEWPPGEQSLSSATGEYSSPASSSLSSSCSAPQLANSSKCLNNIMSPPSAISTYLSTLRSSGTDDPDKSDGRDGLLPLRAAADDEGVAPGTRARRSAASVRP